MKILLSVSFFFVFFTSLAQIKGKANKVYIELNDEFVANSPTDANFIFSKDDIKIFDSKNYNIIFGSDEMHFSGDIKLLYPLASMGTPSDGTTYVAKDSEGNQIFVKIWDNKGETYTLVDIIKYFNKTSGKDKVLWSFKVSFLP